MNIAIIIGISKYGNNNDLPACKNDATIFSEILKLSKKEFEIFEIYESESISSKEIREEIIEIIEKFRDEQIDELVFFYSGHGALKDEFYYVPSNFDPKKYHDTGISNLEMDNYLKQINPRLAVKIVDACHSGNTYIKEDNNNIINKTEKDTEETFNNCYFFFSCLDKEKSSATKEYSLFSFELFKAISNFENGEIIRYSDLSRKIADSFYLNKLENEIQTPYFVTQSKMIECFFQMNKELKDYLDEELKKYTYELSENIEISIDSETEDNDIKANKIINEIEKKYISEEELSTILSEIKMKIEEYEIDKRFCQLKYEFRKEFKFKEDYNEKLSKEEKIANWLNENKPDYFINYLTEERSETVYKWENKPIARNSLLRTIDYMLPQYEPVRVKDTQYFDVISGYKIKENNLPYNLIKLIYENNKKCFRKYISELTFAYSNKSITFFYYFSYYKLVNWNDENKSLNFDWKIKEFNFENDREPILSWIKTYLDEFYDYIKTDIKESLNLDLSK